MTVIARGLLREFVDHSHGVVESAPEALDEENQGGGFHACEVGGSCVVEVAAGESEACELWSVQAWARWVGCFVAGLHGSPEVRRLTVVLMSV